VKFDIIAYKWANAGVAAAWRKFYVHELTWIRRPHMFSRTVLTVGIELGANSTESANEGNTKVVRLGDAEAVLDWLWERGDEVESLIVRNDLMTTHLRDILQRDWPHIQVMVN
jgi:hypothetical protein